MGYLAHKRVPSPRNIQYACAQGPMLVLRGWRFITSEILLHCLTRHSRQLSRKAHDLWERPFQRREHMLVYIDNNLCALVYLVMYDSG